MNIVKHQIIIERPFPGYSITGLFTYEDGSTQVQYKPTGYTFEHWCLDNLDRVNNIQLVDEDGPTLDALMREYEQGFLTDPKPIDNERYNDMLEVLPPCKWSNYGGYEAFHVSERITGNVVSWFAKSGDSYYEFEDMANISRSDLITKLHAIKG